SLTSCSDRETIPPHQPRRRGFEAEPPSRQLLESEMRILKTAVPLVLVALALSACTATAEPGGDDGTSSGHGDDLTIAMVTHGTAGDAFWDVVKSGAEQAASDLGVSLTYQGDGDALKQSELINAAVAQKPDGLVVSLANPDGVRSAIEAAVAAGIPSIA